MGQVYDFEQARTDKYVQKPYVAPEAVTIPEFVQEGIDDQRAKQRRALLRAAVALIDSGDIPASTNSTESEPLPAFDYLPSEEK
jgi:hypothetical protein